MKKAKERKGGAGKKSAKAHGPEDRAGRRADIRAEELAEWVRKARDLPPVRRELLERVRAEIAAGTYETPQKLEKAVTRLLAELRDG